MSTPGLPDSWTIDLKALYGSDWDERGRWGLREELRECPDGKGAFLLYHIAEIGVMKEAGRLAVYDRNARGRPRLLKAFPDLLWWVFAANTVQFAGAEPLAVLHLMQVGLLGRILPTKLRAEPWVFDLSRRKHGRLELPADDFYEVIGASTQELTLKAENAGRTLTANLNAVSWKPF